MYVVVEGIRKEPARTWSIICNYVIIVHIYINHCYIYTCVPAMHKCEKKIIIHRDYYHRSEDSEAHNCITD